MNEIMKPRFRLYRRHAGMFYLFDRLTGKRESLETSDPAAARRLLHARNEAQQQPLINRQIARAYLAASDPEIGRRTWRIDFDEIVKTKHGPTQERWYRASRDQAFDLTHASPSDSKLSFDHKALKSSQAKGSGTCFYGSRRPYALVVVRTAPC